MNLLAQEFEPDNVAITLHQCDLYLAKQTLKPRWSFRSHQPLVSALENNRAAILALIESSERILESLVTAAEPHSCDRPEDCGHPECRAQVESWQADHYALLTRDPADHPKVNSTPNDRELAMAWDA